MSENVEKKTTILHIYILIITTPAHRTANMKGILCSATVTWWDNLYCDAALYCLSQTASRNHHHYTAERMYACVSVWVCLHTRDAFLQAFVEGTGADLQQERRGEPMEGFDLPQPGQYDVHILSGALRGSVHRSNASHIT